MQGGDRSKEGEWREAMLIPSDDGLLRRRTVSARSIRFVSRFRFHMFTNCPSDDLQIITSIEILTSLPTISSVSSLQIPDRAR